MRPGPSSRRSQRIGRSCRLQSRSTGWTRVCRSASRVLPLTPGLPFRVAEVRPGKSFTDARAGPATIGARVMVVVDHLGDMATATLVAALADADATAVSRHQTPGLLPGTASDPTLPAPDSHSIVIVLGDDAPDSGRFFVPEAAPVESPG